MIRSLKYQEVYAQEKVTKVDSLSLVLSGKWVYIGDYISFTFFLHFMVILQISSLTKSKSFTYCVSTSVPRFSRMVWSINRWLFPGKRIHAPKWLDDLSISNYLPGVDNVDGGVTCPDMASRQIKICHNGWAFFTSGLRSHTRTWCCEETDASDASKYNSFFIQNCLKIGCNFVS
jgi:hypothetical protein